jgi:hypothetical protein
MISLSGSRFGKLTQEKKNFNFILQHWIYWKLSFTIYFDLFYMKLSLSHDSSREFNMLIQVCRTRFNMFLLLLLLVLNMFHTTTIVISTIIVLKPDRVEEKTGKEKTRCDPADPTGDPATRLQTC